MVQRLNMAVVGLGRMGKRHVHTLLVRVPRANVVAVCSDQPHETAWAREHYADDGIAVYDSYDAMLEHPGLEAVWVSSSTDVHASQALGAIKKGKHCLCEKPLSTDLEEVRTGTN
jgi:myo-inositol 2-dehydrogenase/D-chiro-inositol 1-dehydrogenase